MKNYLRLLSAIFLLQFVSCGSFYNGNSLETTDGEFGCPEGYECYAKIMQDKSIEIDQSNDNMQLVSDETQNVVNYVYKYIGDINDASDDFEENVYFQIPVNQKEIIQLDEDLISNKMLIQKSCQNCDVKDFEMLNKGYLYVNQANGQYQIFFEISPSEQFKIKKVKTTVYGNKYGYSYSE